MVDIITINGYIVLIMLINKTQIKILFLENNTSGAQIGRDNAVGRTAISHTIAGRCKSKRLRNAIAKAINLKVEEIWPEENGNKAA